MKQNNDDSEDRCASSRIEMETKFLSIKKQQLDDLIRKKSDEVDFHKSYLYSTIAETKEISKQRILHSLRNDVKNQCDQYLASPDFNLRLKIRYLFGEDRKKTQNDLHDLFNSISEIASSFDEKYSVIYAPDDFISEEKKLPNFALQDELFLCLRYDEFCPACSGVLQSHNQTFMKKYAKYQTNKMVGQSKLTFTSLHNGKFVDVSLTALCQKCSKDKPMNKESVTLRTTPVIENASEKIELLFQNPQEYIQNVIYKWIDDHP